MAWEGDQPWHEPSVADARCECNACRYMPMCLGPCSNKREALHRHGLQFKCYIENRDEAMEENIRAACRNVEIACRAS